MTAYDTLLAAAKAAMPTLNGDIFAACVCAPISQRLGRAVTCVHCIARNLRTAIENAEKETA